VIALAGLGWQVARQVVEGSDVALVQTVTRDPNLRDPAAPLRIELV
jgi:hypothetical protein